MDATSLEITVVVGARIVVIAIGRDSRLADSSCTCVITRTDIAVVAESLVGLEDTTHVRLTRVIGAGIDVLAGKLAGRDALAKMAMVAGRADVLIVTGSIRQHVNTSLSGVANVVGAWIIIVAVNPLSCLAGTINAVITQGAGIAVIALGFHCDVDTSDRCITGIRGTIVVVIAG
jgi:hypothetical protein